MVVESVLAVAGLVLVTVAADHLVLGASRVATWLRISPVVVGVVVIGLGTSAPEFLVSGVAAASGDGGIAVGNLVGSNVLNVTLILGVAALVAPVGVSSTVIRREVRLTVAAVFAFAVAAWFGLSVWTAGALGVATLVAVGLLIRWANEGRNRTVAQAVEGYTETPAVIDVQVRRSQVPGWFEPVRALLGLGGVLIGAQLLVANASAIASRLGVSQLVIGLTLVAFGTSLPELVTTIAGQRRGESELVVGNLFGSNLFNSLAGAAIVGFAGRTGIGPRPSFALLGVMVLTAVLAWALLRSGLRLTRLEGLLLAGVALLALPIALAG